MDIRQFFDSVDHQILKIFLKRVIKGENTFKIIDVIIDSFKLENRPINPVGIPLGNVTSQLFTNVYLHELDDFVKQDLWEKYYLRYCDDFIILSNDENHLKSLIRSIREFLKFNLHLELHLKKTDHQKIRPGH